MKVEHSGIFVGRSYLWLSEHCSLNTERAEVKLTEEAAEPLSLEAGEVPAVVRTALAGLGADKGQERKGAGQVPAL